MPLPNQRRDRPLVGQILKHVTFDDDVRDDNSVRPWLMHLSDLTAAAMVAVDQSLTMDPSDIMGCELAVTFLRITAKLEAALAIANEAARLYAGIMEVS